jgi:hypothetical protein
MQIPPWLDNSPILEVALGALHPSASHAYTVCWPASPWQPGLRGHGIVSCFPSPTGRYLPHSHLRMGVFMTQLSCFRFRDLCLLLFLPTLLV